ncbi:GAF domain-containing protein, partial [Nocardioides kribbensis]|uniref:GAF domain-containing protein n=1 Tax=Nocardioides kribbensis TaxID=305517 RepID=UPI001D0CE847
MSQLAPDRPHSPEGDEPSPVPRLQAPLTAPLADLPSGATAPTRDEPTGDQLLAALPTPAVVVDAAGTVRHANDLADLAWRMTASPGSEDSVVDLPLARLLPLEPGTLTPGPADRGPRRLRVSHVGRDLDVVVTLVREGAHPLQLVTLTDVTDAVATERVREADTRDRAAVHRVEAGVAAATTELEAARTAIERVREEFGWAYGSYWRIDEADRTLKFTLESGDAGPEFREVTRRSSFAEGVGLSGRAWRSRDLFFTPDLGEMTDCVRAPVAQRVGVKSGVCFPIVVDGDVVGTMDFFATETLSPSPQRLEALRNVGRLVSAALERIARDDAEKAAAADLAEKVEQVLEVVRAASAGDLTREVTLTGTDAIGQLAAGLSTLLTAQRDSM